MSKMLSSELWHNPLAPRLPRWLGWLFVVAAFGYALVLFTPLERPKLIDITFLAIGLVGFVRYSPLARGGGAPWLLGLVTLQLVITWALLMLDFPDLARSGPTLEDFLDKFLFLFLALALAGQRRWVAALLGSAAVLILLMPWVLGNGWVDFRLGLAGGRVGFGLNPIRTALYFSVVMLGLMAFVRPLVASPTFSWLRLGLWGGLMAYAAVVILMTQTRGVLLALVLMLATMAVLTLRSLPRLRRLPLRYWLGGLCLLVAIGGMVVQSGLLGSNVQRFQSEAGVIDAVTSGDEGLEIPNSSWGLRVQFWQLGVERIAERPVAGWGYRSARYFLEQAARESPQFRGYRQLHNSYLEAGISYGMGGMLLLVGLFGWVLWRCRVAYHGGGMEIGFYLFSVTSIGFVMCCSLVYGLLFSDDHGLNLYTLVMGCALSMSYAGKRRANDAGEAAADSP
ncbi:O-antigen ligase family protein [Marinobacter xestospongiae]|uniref:O-antigen ligase family protein n=1 Tax=Marinobacter xestospongiae TaxID=994319 RepID=UPI00200470F0|nr:O-antigen ligase family protein [Marinobacter xestospongiae]MCK7568310.1 O-antigen ligase family protein [Marinobacter xestospongiae]